MFLDGPHVLQPADLVFGDSTESLEVADPEVAPRGWGFKPTPENLEPGLVEALEKIKDALSKDTYVVRAQNWPVVILRSSPLNHFIFEPGRVSSVSVKEREWLRLSLRW